MLIQTSDEAPPGIDLFIPAGFNVLWNTGVLVVLVGLGVGVALVVRAATRAPGPSLHDLVGVDPVRRAARRHAATVSVAAVTAALLAGAVVVQAGTAAVGGLAEGVLLGLSPAVVGLTFLAAHGAFYGTWLALATVLVVAGAEGVLRLVARRPAVAQVDEAWDLALRRASAHRVLRGAQLALGLTAAATLGVGASAAARAGYPGAVVLVVVAVALALAVAAVAVRPAPDPDAWVDTRASARAAVGGAGHAGP